MAEFGAVRYLARYRGLVGTSAHRTTALSLARELTGGVVR